MRWRARHVAPLLLATTVGLGFELVGCKNLDGPFVCTSSSQCILTAGGANGRCESSGYCSFADSQCASGYRYAAVSGTPFAKMCTDVVTDGGVDGPADAAGCVTDVSASYRHTCAVRSDGKVWCWGWNKWGQLGDNSLVDRLAPVEVSGLTSAAEVVTGAYYSCARDQAGSIWCWGGNQEGSLGLGDYTLRSVPTLVPGLTGMQELAAGGFQTCARHSDGRVSCWGAGPYGEIGNGTFNYEPSPVEVSGLANATQLAMGRYFSCALTSSGTVFCWGRNDSGQLGNATGNHSNVPVQVEGLPPGVTSIFGHQGFHACAIAGGNTYCWGANGVGQVGDGTTTNRPVATRVQAVTGIVDGDTGANSTCGRLDAGTLWCWGQNYFRELATEGAPLDAHPPMLTSGLPPLAQVSFGYFHACGRTNTGHLLCWGRNQMGQLGDGTRSGREAPTTVSMLTGATQVSGGLGHSCARKADGTVSCWGYNHEGQLGDGSMADRLTPVAVTGLNDAQMVASGGHHTCALRTGGNVVCWGLNESGQLGTNSFIPENKPNGEVSNLPNAVSIATGDYSSCALKSDATVVCWGDNTFGQLGDNTALDRRAPVAVMGLTNVAKVVAGRRHACARKTDGTVWCWGLNASGQLGDNTVANRAVPVAAMGVTSATDIAAGRDHTCAVNSSGTMSCWGLNRSGQLGVGDFINRPIPTAVVGITTAAEAAGAFDNTCVRKFNNNVACWGDTESGVVGDGTNDDVSINTPVHLSTAFSVNQISGGEAHFCARKTDGTVACWGRNTLGEIGDGTRVSQPPVMVHFPPCP